MRTTRSGSSANQPDAGTMIAATAAFATARKIMIDRNAASGDGKRRRSNHSSIGTSAIAMTSAAVTGRKNAAPA